MHYRLDIKGWRFYTAITHSVKVRGVNSRLPDGQHFLMWDFDDKDPKDVLASLAGVQHKYRLPKIYIVNTGREGYYHAYCFKKMSFPDLIRILADTPGLDKAYFTIGILRSFYTLRYSPKGERSFLPASILPSRVKEELNPFELNNFCEYWTKRI